MAYADVDVIHNDAADTNVVPVPVKVPDGAGDCDAADTAARKAVLTLASKEIAAGLGARVLRDMLAERGVSMRQVARMTGFDVSVLSNIARGKHVSGPELWTLIALASAMGYDLDLTFRAQ
ncbi:MAG: helix-turn-helix transcriptional regulator [Pseudomonadota bacterium]